jgi:hypothetical protein
VRTVPLHVFHPAWADDENFEIGYHVRHTAVPNPGRPRQLRQLAGRIFAQRLDRDRPLWEAWLLGASRAAAGRCSRRCTTAWWMASAAPT